MSGGIYCHFTVGRAGAGSANVRYITRESGTGGNDENLYLHNYPSFVQENKNYKYLKQNVVEYNRQREEDELTRRRTGSGQTRTHYRCKLSFEEKISTEKAREMAREYLEQNFAGARAIAAVHQDTKHTHIHINIQARGLNEKKIQLGEGKFKNLDSAWAKIYGREFGQEKQQEHEQKKQETREWKQEYARAKERGEDVIRQAPIRADQNLLAQEHKAREARNYGIDQTRAGRDQRGAANRDQARAGGERAIGNTQRAIGSSQQQLAKAERTVERAVGQAERAVSETRNLQHDAARVAERERGIDRTDQRER